LTTRFTGMRESRRAACVAVRGKPSRMKDAEGSSEGCAGIASLTDVCRETQRFDLSSLRISLRIMSSGTRLPAFIADSARRPVTQLVDLGVSLWTRLLTERCSIVHILPQQIPRTDGRELRKPVHHPLCLCPFPHPWGPHKDNTRCSFELFRTHSVRTGEPNRSKRCCRLANVPSLEPELTEWQNPARGSEVFWKLNASEI